MNSRVTLQPFPGPDEACRRNLTLALQLASDSGNQHIKPVVLTLLACQFTNTRNDQAFRMLHSAREFRCSIQIKMEKSIPAHDHLPADAICGSLGGADRYKDKEPKVKNETEGVLEPAGMARLGLWSGIRLLGTAFAVAAPRLKAQAYHIVLQKHIVKRTLFLK